MQQQATETPVLPTPSSTTHLHLFAAVNTLVGERATRKGLLRILDIGCGDGRLMRYLHQMFTRLNPDITVEVHGFDVREHGYGVHEEYERAIRILCCAAPEIDWRQRIRAISVEDPWPYPEEFFDAAVSNQVLEHVADADHFFASLRRVLKPDGLSVHLFPLRNGVLEGHLQVPFAHRIRDINCQQAWIRTSNRLGLGRWPRDRIIFHQSDLAEYARSQSHYLNVNTFYRTFADFDHICKRNHMSISYHYTKDYYFAKLRRLAGRQPKLRYRKLSQPIGEWLGYIVLRYVAGVTLLVAPTSYDVAQRKHAEKNFVAELVEG